jgi:formate dehydrogenase iron-sulfur subunit
MSLATHDYSAPSNDAATPADIDGVVFALLREQQSMSAVSTFSEWHDSTPAHAQHYRALLPATPLQPGEQYAFEVDLDVCSGCKACVTACHSLNGLDKGETWRSVGLLTHTRLESSVVHHVTTACHHCVEPGCLSGCPVMAYDKDPVTGIVRHLDDQCIGCQYCVLMCPYEVPQYSAKRGIVRKCDMCRQRLAADEAPACVQSCPNQAIRITKVTVEEARSRSANPLLPATAPSTLTTPTTIYKTRLSDESPEKWVAGDEGNVHPAHAHWPLVYMLVLTQASVGLLAWWGWAVLFDQGNTSLRFGTLLVSVLLGTVGGAAASFHLGNPWGAWRVFLGLRTSWLSREAIAFGKYGPLSGAILTAEYLGWPVWLRLSLAVATFAVGVFGVVCSIYIYAVTGRPIWSLPRVAARFTLTGVATALSIALFVVALGRGSTTNLIVASSLVTLVSVAVSTEPFFSRSKPLRRSQFLLRGPLRRIAITQITFSVLAGCVLPLFSLVAPAGFAATDILGWAVFARFAAEILERQLFFESGVTAGMPRGQQ